MTEPANPTAAVPFTVVTIFRHSAAFMFQHPGFFLGLMALEGLLIYISQILPPFSMFLWLVWPGVILGAVAHGVFQTRCDQPLRIGAALGQGLRGILPGASITLQLGLCLFLILSLFTGDQFYIPMAAVVITLAGAFSLYSYFIPACVLERPGFMERVERPAHGHWSTIFIAYLASTLLATLLAYLIIHGIEPRAWMLFFSAVLATLTIVVKGVIDAVIYCELREAKEDGSLDSLARVFD